MGRFDNYLTTAFSGTRNIGMAYKFFDDDYRAHLPGDTHAAILDLGCGTGELVSYLRFRGYDNVIGIDASLEMAVFCQKNGIAGIECVDDAKAYLARYAGYFDLVVMNDVIEHMPKHETVAMLQAVGASLKKGGILLVRTGNAATPGGMYLRYKDFTHEIGYTELSLDQVLRMAGFTSVSIKGNSYPWGPKPLTFLRAIVLKIWFFILQAAYFVELGCDRPTIYSKLLIAIARKVA